MKLILKYWYWHRSKVTEKFGTNLRVQQQIKYIFNSTYKKLKVFHISGEKIDLSEIWPGSWAKIKIDGQPTPSPKNVQDVSKI